MLKIENLQFSYDRRTILQGVNFTVKTKELLHITGANGVGKSTLLSAIVGLNPIQKGQIKFYWDEKEVEEPHSYIEYLPAEANGLFGKLSAKRNLEYFIRIRHKNSSDDVIKQALLNWGLGNELILKTLPVEKYSTGMKRRLSLARVTLSQCPLWILDEPIYGLDKKGIEQFQNSLKSHIADGGLGIIVSHDTSPIEDLVTHTLELPRGEFTQKKSHS